MNPAPRATSRHRLAGLALAAAGVALARFGAPAFAPGTRMIVTLAGAMIAGSGLFVIALGVRHRLRREASVADDAASEPAAHVSRP